MRNGKKYNNDPEHNMRFKVLLSIMQMKGIKIKDFADYMGIHKSVLSQIITGKRDITLRELDYWCKGVGCTLTISLTQDFKKVESKYLKNKVDKRKANWEEEEDENYNWI